MAGQRRKAKTSKSASFAAFLRMGMISISPGASSSWSRSSSVEKTDRRGPMATFAAAEAITRWAAAGMLATFLQATRWTGAIIDVLWLTILGRLRAHELDKGRGQRRFIRSTTPTAEEISEEPATTTEVRKRKLLHRAPRRPTGAEANRSLG